MTSPDRHRAAHTGPPASGRHRLIVHLRLPATDPDTVVALIGQLDRLLRGLRTAVCSGWLSADDGPEPQPHLTAWLDLDCALVLTRLDAEHALVELHLTAGPTTTTTTTTATIV